MSRKPWRAATSQLPALWFSTELTPQAIAQLVQFSQTDNLVRTQTHDASRFASLEKIQQWMIGRELILLETEQGDLLGIVWLSQKTLPELSPEYQLTFGIRLYGLARGKGLAIPFLKAALADFRKTVLWQKNPAAKLWLQTKVNNIPAIETYKALGFTQFSEPDAEQEIVML